MTSLTAVLQLVERVLAVRVAVTLAVGVDADGRVATHELAAVTLTQLWQHSNAQARATITASGELCKVLMIKTQDMFCIILIQFM